ncbi:hypothetical protein NSA45_10365 [Paraclostridium bifermentans]|uniref:hypothetical protein n=2 Tax=Clostridia TaxID=186801 RepID=UPI001F3B4395|nr:hypothetical protein [Paraclostridium bifermentans]MCR1876270.1 hypothetical protein [Paraclostridium bifermentans]
MVNVREIDSILVKFEDTINSYNEFENIGFNRKHWNELKEISVEKLINNQDIDEIWIEKAKVVFEKRLPLEACLIFNKYLNNTKENIPVEVYKYNDKIIDILHSKTFFNLPGDVLLKYSKKLPINEDKKYKIPLLTRKLLNLKKVELITEKLEDFLVGVKIDNINKIELMNYSPKFDNYIYTINESIEFRDLEEGRVLCKYNKDKNIKDFDTYTTVVNCFYIQKRKMSILNDFERMLTYELANQIYTGKLLSKLNKKVISCVLDNKKLFEDEYFNRIIQISNLEDKNNTAEYINELIKNPNNKNLKSIIKKADSIDEIFSVLRQSEVILDEEVGLDVYVEAICKCYEKSKTSKNAISKMNIALFCEELIAEKPIVFTEVIDILREMYKEKIFTNKTIDTLRYIRHTVKDEKIIDDILLQIKYENCEFDNDFIEKISKFDDNPSKSDITLIDKMLNKIIYNEEDISKYNDKIFKLIYNFYKRNNDLKALHKLCEFSYKNNNIMSQQNITDKDICKLIQFYEDNDIKLDVDYKLSIINEYKNNQDILKYGELVVELIYVNKDENGIQLLNSKYNKLLKKLKKNSDIIHEEYLKMLESNSKNNFILDEDEIEDIKAVLNRKAVHSNTKLYMLKILINYFIVTYNENEMLKYMNLYIANYSELDKGELFKSILYNHSNNIEFLEIILNKLDFNSITNADIFMQIISSKLINNMRLDLLSEVLRYYIANEKYIESIDILKVYISKNIKLGNLIKNIDVQINELQYYTFINPILNNISEKFQIEIYNLLIKREDLPIEIREQYFYLAPTEENKKYIIDSFSFEQTKSELAKEFALKKYFSDDEEFLRLANIGKDNNEKILELVYYKAREKFKNDKDYVNKLIEKIYKEDERLSKIYEYIELYNDNYFDRKAQNIFNEYLCTHRDEGEYIDRLYLKNIFNGNKLEAIGFMDDEYKVDYSIFRYLDKIKANYEKLDKDVILLREIYDLSFLEKGDVLVFLEKLKLLIKLQINLILNERMIIGFKKDSFIINEKGFIPTTSTHICRYNEEFRTRNSALFEYVKKTSKSKYIIVNEKNICTEIKGYIKSLLLETNINEEIRDIKDKFIVDVLENNYITSYEDLLECIDEFIENENKKFENFTYKEKLKVFDELDEFEKYDIVNQILYSGDTSLIAKKIIISYDEDNIEIERYIKYLIDCFNNSNIGFNEDDYIRIYEKVNINIESASDKFYEEMKNEIFNFYINAKNQLKIYKTDLKEDVTSLKISDKDKDYLISRI